MTELGAESGIATWANEHAGAFEELAPAEVAVVVGLWREVATAAGVEGAELAGPFQLTDGAGELPEDLCLALTASEVVVLELDPSHPAHPLEVDASQLDLAPATRWARESVRVTVVASDRTEAEVSLGIDGTEPLPCRTPELRRNPAAAAVISALGAELPAA